MAVLLWQRQEILNPLTMDVIIMRQTFLFIHAVTFHTPNATHRLRPALQAHPDARPAVEAPLLDRPPRIR